MRTFLLLVLALVLVLTSSSLAQRSAKHTLPKEKTKDLAKYDAITEPPRELTLFERIQAASKEAFTSAALYEDFARTMGSNMNWEEMLCPAPLGITVLGDLIVLAAEMSDFSSNEVPKEGGYKYMSYPSSFRASLVQISNTGYNAFMRAHTNMDKIRLYAQNVPDYMKDVTRILMSRNPRVFSKMLPRSLARIKEVAEQSVKLSKQVVNSFWHVMNLTSEVIKVTTATKGLKEDQIEDLRLQQKILNESLAFQQVSLDVLKKQEEDMQKLVKDAEDEVRKAKEEQPSGWEMIGMNAVENLSNFLTLGFIVGSNTNLASLADSIKGIFSGPTVGLSVEEIQCVQMGIKWLTELYDSSKTLSAFAEKNFTTRHLKQSFQLPELYAKLEDIERNNYACKPIEKLAESGKKVLEDVEELLQARNTTEPSKGIENKNANTTSAVNTQLEAGNANETVRAQEHSTDGAHQMTATTEVPKMDEKTVRTKVKEYVESVNSLHQQSLAKQIMPSKNPFVQQSATTSGRASEYAAQRASNRLFLAYDNIKAVKEEHERKVERILQMNTTYNEKLAKLHGINIKEISYDKLLKHLTEGLRILGQLKQHWTGLVMYFEFMASLIEIRMSTNLDDFRNLTEDAGKDISLLYDITYLTFTFEMAMKASQAAYYVHSMANMYTKISAQHLIPNLAKLDQLITFNVQTASSSMLEMRTELAKAGAIGTQAIMDLVKEERDRVIAQLETRIRNLEKDFSFIFNQREIGQEEEIIEIHGNQACTELELICT